MSWLLDLLFPPKCPFCGRVLDQYLRGEDSPPEHFTRGLFYRGVE